MELVDNSRYIDALLLLSLRANEVEGERVVSSTSCISSAVLVDMTELSFIDYSKRSGNYVITDKGMLTLKYVKKPWDEKYMFKKPVFIHQSAPSPYSL